MNYLKIYNQLIYKRQFIQPLTKTHNGTIETQHIIPRSCNGPNDKWNKVNLTLREHYFAHELLVQIYKGTKYELAAIRSWNCMSRKMGQQIKSSRLYKQLRLAYNKRAGESIKGKIVINNGKKNRYIYANEKLPAGFIYGKKPLSEIAKKHICQANIKRSKPKVVEKQKAPTNRGKIWINNGIIQKIVFQNEIPVGFIKGQLSGKTTSLKGSKQSKEHIEKRMLKIRGIKKPKKYGDAIRLRQKGHIYVNNGLKTILVYPDKIPIGYVKGRLKK